MQVPHHIESHWQRSAQTDSNNVAYPERNACSRGRGVQSMSRTALTRSLAVVASLVVVLAIVGTAAAQRTAVTGYTVNALVSDQMGAAPTTDTNLVNPWGIVAGPTTPWWVANNVTNTSTSTTVRVSRSRPPRRSSSRSRAARPESSSTVAHSSSFRLRPACRPLGSSLRPRAGRFRPGRAGRQRNSWPTVRLSTPPTSGSQSRGTGSMQPTSTITAWTCSTAPSTSFGRWGRSVRRSAPARRLFTLRDPEHRWTHLRRLCEAGCGRRRRGRRARARHRRRVQRERFHCSRGSRATVSSTRPGALRWRPRAASVPCPAHSSSATSATDT